MPARFRILPGPGAGAPIVARDVDVGAGLDEIRVGRRADLELPLPFAALSALHARVRREASGWTVEDTGSTNGTWLGGERLAPGQRRPLARGAELRLGNVRLRFEGDGPVAGAADGTGTIARRLVDDLFGATGEGAPIVRVVRGAPERRLELLELGRAYVIGRSETCALPLAVEEVSREHATLTRLTDGVLLRDLGSKNGVTLSGARVAAERRLTDGDHFEVGPVTLAFSDPVDRYLRELEAAPEPLAAPQAVRAAPAVEEIAEPAPPASTAPRLALIVGVLVLLLLGALVAAVILSTP